MRPHTLLLPATTLLLAAAPLPLRASIPWQGDWAEAKERAKTERRVLFLAVNMDGERANDRLAEEVYREKEIVALAERTVPVVASAFAHGRGTCGRFGTISCEAHRAIDVRARAEVLQADESGSVVAPQHVFLAPNGEVLLSVPYEVTAPELEWCLAEAIRRVDPEADLRVSTRARPPKRLVLDGVEGSGGPSPLTREELLALLKEARKSRGGQEEVLRRILTADEEEARDFVTQELRRSAGGGGGRGGGGASAGSNEAGSGPWARQELMVRRIGEASPPSWWEVIEEFATSSDEDLREEVAAALEQLQAPESRKLVSAAFRKEREPRLQGVWLRALASVAPADKSTWTAIEKAAGRKSNATLRVQALLAAGWAAPSEERDALLRGGLSTQGQMEVAALAMALTRERAFLEDLDALPAEARDGEVILASRKVLEGGALTPLGPLVARIAGDEVPRPRFFGRE